MQQFAFYTVVRWHKLRKVDIECTLHISKELSINVLKLSNLIEIWQNSDKNKLGHFWRTLYI